MALDVPSVQRALREDGLDGWLLYDFHGSNPIAAKLTGLAGSHKIATRRWYYLIPADGEPRGLVHAIEAHNLDGMPGEKRLYAGRQQLADGLRELLKGVKRVAMEYSPECALPYLSRVDGGTIEMVRGCGPEVVPSGDLVQRFEACWDEAALASHRDASARLYRVKDVAFEAISARLRAGVPTGEYEIQQVMVDAFGREGLVTDDDPIVAAQENAGNPHYAPAADVSRAIGRDELVLLDLWGKIDRPGAVFADITWMGYTGPSVPAEYARAFEVIASGRDAAVALVQSATRGGRVVRGWEVDRAASDVIRAAGYGDWILHRTGHSLGEDVHGNGVHMDDYETHDDRRLLPGAGFTIEPGVYTNRFGLRTEINMVVGERDAEVTGPVQSEIVTLL